MIELERKDFKDDPEFGILFRELKKIHKIAPHTIEILEKNAGVKDFCENSRCFVEMHMRNPKGESKAVIYMHYDVNTWLNDGIGSVSFRSIGIYEDAAEYEIAKFESLNTKPGAVGSSLN